MYELFWSKLMLTYLHKASKISSEVQSYYDESDCQGLCHIVVGEVSSGKRRVVEYEEALLKSLI